MRFLLDTDTCIAVLRQRQKTVQRLNDIDPASCAVSIITVFELLSGVEKAQNHNTERHKVARLISMVTTLSLDHEDVDAAAKVRTYLEREGMPIGPYDLLIAGQALTNDLILVTNNVREFQRVKGLKWESWA